MSFMYDKPLIVRILQITFAIAGVFLVYIAAVGASYPVFSVITLAIGIVCLVCGKLVTLRKWYAWHLTLAALLLFAGYLVMAYLETADIMWIMAVVLDMMIVLSWSVGFTRQYFDAAA